MCIWAGGSDALVPLRPSALLLTASVTCFPWSLLSFCSLLSITVPLPSGPDNPVVIKFSGGVFPVLFTYHHFWHLSFGCDFAFADLRLLGLYADFRRQSPLGPAGIAGSGHSKIANNSPLKTVPSGEGAKFLILRAWTSWALFPLSRCSFFTGLDFVFKFTLPPLEL